MTQALTKIVTDYRLEKSMGENLVATFKPYFETVEPLLQEAKMCMVDDPDDAEGIERSRVLWKAIKDARCAAENKAEEMRRPAMELSKAIAFAPKLLAGQTKPVEDRLYAQWKLPEEREKARKAALGVARAKEIGQYQVLLPRGLEDMPEEEYQGALTMARDAQAKREAERREADQRSYVERVKAQLRQTRQRQLAAVGDGVSNAVDLAEVDEEAFAARLAEATVAKRLTAERKAQEEADRQAREQEAAETERKRREAYEAASPVQGIADGVDRAGGETGQDYMPVVETRPQPTANADEVAMRAYVRALMSVARPHPKTEACQQIMSDLSSDLTHYMDRIDKL